MCVRSHKPSGIFNKCHTWPFIDFNISSLFILIYFLLYLSTFSCHHFAAMARMFSLFSNCCYKFPVFFSISGIKFLQFYDSLLIVDTFIKSVPYCLDAMLSVKYAASVVPPISCQTLAFRHSLFWMLNSGIMLPRFRVRFLPRSFRHSYS